MKRVAIANTDYEIMEERLSSLCKLYRKGESEHFAQIYVQTGTIGDCVIKGLESKQLSFRERKRLHNAMWSHIHNSMGYDRGTIQRIKDTKTMIATTITKSLARFKRDTTKT